VRLATLREGVTIALAAIGSNKLRSALTILGVVIGVSTVMAMASIVEGLRSQIIRTIEVAGPTTFYVVRFFSQTPLNPDALPREVRIRPVLEADEAELIARLPDIAYGAIWIQMLQRMEYQGTRTQLVTIYAADGRYMEIAGGTLLSGRFFLDSELRGGDAVVVIEERFATRLFGQLDPLGRTLRIGGRPLRVVGVYQNPANIFQPPTQEIAAVVPYETAHRYFRYDETNALWIVVKPRPGVTVEDAQASVTVALRRHRQLRPGDPDTFDFITQDQILDIFNQLTGIFFLVMVALSSVALMVGGIGVMAIMMVSVTDRTREIGVRKAVGATRREILWQFLVEAATLTMLGGAVGVIIGIAAGEVLKSILGFSAGVPLWSAAVACVVSAAIGLFFGLLPANRAAKLEPVEALRYE
jgi:putative ABC transport system permease protein